MAAVDEASTNQPKSGRSARSSFRCERVTETNGTYVRPCRTLCLPADRSHSLPDPRDKSVTEFLSDYGIVDSEAEEIEVEIEDAVSSDTEQFN